jgi:hypothetical protein
LLHVVRSVRGGRSNLRPRPHSDALDQFLSRLGAGYIALLTIALAVHAQPVRPLRFRANRPNQLNRPSPSVTLAVLPSPVEVSAGGPAAAATVTFARTNFSGGVTLAAAARLRA